MNKKGYIFVYGVLILTISLNIYLLFKNIGLQREYKYQIGRVNSNIEEREKIDFVILSDFPYQENLYLIDFSDDRVTLSYTFDDISCIEDIVYAAENILNPPYYTTNIRQYQDKNEKGNKTYYDVKIVAGGYYYDR